MQKTSRGAFTRSSSNMVLIPTILLLFVGGYCTVHAESSNAKPSQLQFGDIIHRVPYFKKTSMQRPLRDSPVPDVQLDCDIRTTAFKTAMERVGNVRGRGTAVYEALRLQECKVSFTQLLASIDVPKVQQQAPNYFSHSNNAEESIRLFVSPSGNDKNPGTSISAPLRTLTRARDVLRELRRSHGDRETTTTANQTAFVYLREGTYFLGVSGALVLDHRDSHVEYSAWQSERVRISGAVPLTLHLEAVPTDATVSVPVGTCRATITLPAGVGKLDTVDTLFDLTDDSNANLILAREPNGNAYTDLQPTGYALANGNINGTLYDPPTGVHIEIDHPERNSSVYPVWGKDFDPRGAAVWYTHGGIGEHFAGNITFWNGSVSAGLRWNATGGVTAQGYNVSGFRGATWPPVLRGKPTLHAFQRAFWGNQQWAVHSVDAHSQTFTFKHGGWQVSRPLGVGEQPFFVEGVLEALDAAGEYWADDAHGVLYLIPNRTAAAPSGPDPALPPCHPHTMRVAAPQLSRIIDINGADGVSVMGLEFIHSRRTLLAPYAVPGPGDWSIHKGGTITITNAADCKVVDCIFNKTDSNAIFLSERTVRTQIHNNDFLSIGDSAIATVGVLEHNSALNPEISGYPEDTVVTGNHFSTVGIWGKQTSALFSAVTCSTTFRDNVAYNGPRAAININDGFCGGHNISHNVIFNWVRETQDHGPINTWSRMATLRRRSDGNTTIYPEWNHIEHNLIMNGPSGNRDLGNLFPCVDNDDGSAHYYISSNVCVYGGMKNYLGQDKIWDRNVIVYPGRWSGDPCVCAWGGPHNVFSNNVCVTNSTSPVMLDGSIGGIDGCHINFTNSTTTRDMTLATANTYYTVDGNYSLGCGRINYSLQDLQAHAWEVNSHVLNRTSITAPGIMQLVNALL